MSAATPRALRERAPVRQSIPTDESGPVLFAPLPEYLTTRELADYLGYRGKRRQGAAQKFIARAGIRRYWRSARVSLVKRADVDAVVAGRSMWSRK